MAENGKQRNDEDLIGEVARKDHDAFRNLYGRYQGKVFGLVYRYIGNQGVAEDLVQEIFLKVYRSAGKFRPKAKFSTWLYKLVANHCLNYQRYVRARPSGSITDSETEERRNHSSTQAVDPVDPETALYEKERRSAVRKAVDSLPERQRMAVVLQRFEGLSYGEIAEVMDCSVKAVESLLQRAMEELRDSLKKYC